MPTSPFRLPDAAGGFRDWRALDAARGGHVLFLDATRAEDAVLLAPSPAR
jgi:hypothetical protein